VTLKQMLQLLVSNTSRIYQNVHKYVMPSCEMVINLSDLDTHILTVHFNRIFFLTKFNVSPLFSWVQVDGDIANRCSWIAMERCL